MLYDSSQRTAAILIVDDQPSTVRLLREVVRDLGEVMFASSGKTALEMVRRSPPDLVLLDIEMPGISGFDVCKAIKSDPVTRDIAIIFVTSHDHDAHEVTALGVGGVDFISKPLNVPIAKARIQTHLDLRQKQRQLIEVRRNLEDVVQNLPAFISQWDAEFRNVFSNDPSGHWVSIGIRPVPGQHLRSVLGESNFLAVEKCISDGIEDNSVSFDISFVRSGGHQFYGQASIVWRNLDGADSGYLLLITDITKRKEAELALYDEKERIRITLNSIGDAVIATDAEGNVSFVNPIAEEMTGWLANESVGLPIENVMPLREGSSGHSLQNPIRLALSEGRNVGMAMNCILTRRDGQALEVEDSAAPIFNHRNELIGAIIVFHDVSEMRAMAIKMTHLANHDALTNLPNRMLLRDRTEQAILNASADSGRVALLIIDIDHFKAINDSSGHSIGDGLLQQVAKRLAQNMRSSDTVSRQGGDEFVSLMQNLESNEHVACIAENLLKVVSEPYWIGRERYVLSVSIGISLFPDDSEDMDDLYHHADAAMYRAKKDGRNRYQFFSAEIENSIRRRHLLEKQLRTALEDHEFQVYFQPKVNARSMRVVGAEALVRWRKSDGQLVLPADFIPLAEETGIIIPLGLAVMRQACLDTKKWLDAGHRIRIAVNVSLAQMAESNFVSSVQAVVAQTGIPPEMLELEITEGMLASDMAQTFETLVALKALGVSIALDDFGTGYSSLAYLKRLPIDVLKIDQSFVRDMLVNDSDAGIVRAIVQMAQSLCLKLVAEGVEHAEQAELLVDLGCELMQGYLYGRPMPIEEFESILSRPPL